MAPARKLPDAVKTRIVTGLASFETPSAIVEAIRDEFGIEISRQTASSYDPGTAAGKRLSERWRALFDQARTAFVKDAAEVGIAHQSVRIRRLETLYRQAEEAKNAPLAAALLRQAAEETGGAYSNRRVLNATITPPRHKPEIRDDMSEAELARLWEETRLETLASIN